MQIERSAGKWERRPSATTTAIGNAAALPIVESSSVSGSPPHRSVSTADNPKTPPRIKIKNTANVIAHATSSHRLHSGRVQLATSITIIAITGWGHENDRERSREAGCDGHLVKPVNLPDLEKLLSEMSNSADPNR